MTRCSGTWEGSRYYVSCSRTKIDCLPVVLIPNTRQEKHYRAFQPCVGYKIRQQERVLVYWNTADKYSYDPAELEIEPGKETESTHRVKYFQSYRQRTQVLSVVGHHRTTTRLSACQEFLKIKWPHKYAIPISKRRVINSIFFDLKTKLPK